MPVPKRHCSKALIHGAKGLAAISFITLCSMKPEFKLSGETQSATRFAPAAANQKACSPCGDRCAPIPYPTLSESTTVHHNMDPSLKPDPSRKGSYYRRIEDIDRALTKLEAHRRPTAAQFLAYYFACEKLARAVVGIHAQLSATKAYAHGTTMRLKGIQAASSALSLSVSTDDLVWIFADFNEQSLLPAIAPHSSARVLRDALGHDFGPTNVVRIAEGARFHNLTMRSFLACGTEVPAYQRAHFSAVP